jgi:hypothetical protein
MRNDMQYIAQPMAGSSEKYYDSCICNSSIIMNDKEEQSPVNWTGDGDQLLLMGSTERQASLLDTQ